VTILVDNVIDILAADTAVAKRQPLAIPVMPRV
jgi:hypothetical protein